MQLEVIPLPVQESLERRVPAAAGIRHVRISQCVFDVRRQSDTQDQLLALCLNGIAAAAGAYQQSPVAHATS